eukprot:6509422-Heterocapsa_arctica.AAC.1
MAQQGPLLATDDDDGTVGTVTSSLTSASSWLGSPPDELEPAISSTLNHMMALPHVAGVVLFYSFARDYGYVRPDEGGRDALIHREYISDGRNVRFGDRILFTA